MNAPPHILVIDDQPLNIKLLQSKLTRGGMEVTTALDGPTGLAEVGRVLPDLILLDIMMPKMSGIDVLHQLRSKESTRSIPVILLTAKTDKDSKIEGLEAGAVDYITKPFDLDETMARVKTQLSIQEIHRQNLNLQNRLAEARRNATVGAITEGIAHNLNNLLGVVVGYLDLLKHAYDKPDMVKRSSMLMDQAVKRIVRIVGQLSTLFTRREVRLEPVTLHDLVQGSVDRFEKELGLECHVSMELSDPGLTVRTNPEIFERSMVQLLANAAESYEDTDERPEVTITNELMKIQDKDRLLVQVNDRGRGIRDDVADHIFEPFTSTKSAVGHGLGLTVARHSIRALGGEIHVQARPEGGTTAILTHPLKKPPAATATVSNSGASAAS